MIYFSLVFDFYTPLVLSSKAFKGRIEKCYQPLLRMAKKRREAKFTLNLCASFTTRIAKRGFSSLIKTMGVLLEKGKVELTGSAAYHALLPKIPSSEIARQVQLDLLINRKFFGERFSPRGFLPPELAYSEKVKNVIESIGYEWVFLDESGFPKKNKREAQFPKNIFLFNDSNLKTFFVNQLITASLLKGNITTVDDLKKEIKQNFLKRKKKKRLNKFFKRFLQNREDNYLIIFFDSFFFHNFTQKKLKFFEQLFSTKTINQEKIRFVTVSQLPNFFALSGRIRPLSSAKRYLQGKTKSYPPFFIWDNPRNKVQKLQWQLLKLALKTFSNPAIEEGDQLKNQARSFLDQGLFSDQFLWSSKKPYWNLKIVEKGARLLQNVVVLMGREREKEKGRILYQEIVTTGRKLYGEKVIKE